MAKLRTPRLGQGHFDRVSSLEMSKSLYSSRTRALSLDEVPEPLRVAVVDHAAKTALLLRDVRVWLTHRENPESSSFLGRLFGRRSNPVDADPAHDMILVLHPTHAIVGTHGPSRGTAVISVPLAHATATRGHALAGKLGGDVPMDDGVTLSGFPGTEGRPGTYFVGLGPGPDAEACFEAVTNAILRAKNPG